MYTLANLGCYFTSMGLACFIDTVITFLLQFYRWEAIGQENLIKIFITFPSMDCRGLLICYIRGSPEPKTSKKNSFAICLGLNRFFKYRLTGLSIISYMLSSYYNFNKFVIFL